MDLSQAFQLQQPKKIHRLKLTKYWPSRALAKVAIFPAIVVARLFQELRLKKEALIALIALFPPYFPATEKDWAVLGYTGLTQTFATPSRPQGVPVALGPSHQCGICGKALSKILQDPWQ